MSANTLFFLLIVALPLAMMLFGRGGAGMGCCGGHRDHDRKPQPDEKQILGPPGAAATAPAPSAPRESRPDRARN